MAGMAIAMLACMAIAIEREACASQAHVNKEASDSPDALVLLQHRAKIVPVHLWRQETAFGASAKMWDALYQEARAVAADARDQGTSPPLLVVAEACVGSTVVMRTAKELLRDQGVSVFVHPAGDELFAKDDNNKSAEMYGSLKAVLWAAKEATASKKTFFFKVKRHWLDGHKGGPITNFLLALQPRTIAVLRDNIVDQLVCKVCDCYDKKNGYPVTPDGKRDHWCFMRHKQNITTLAHLVPDGLIDSLKAEYMDRNALPKQLWHEGSVKPTVVYYEDLMAYEMDASKLDDSATKWKAFTNKLGFSFAADSIRDFLRKGTGTYASPVPHADTIYNINDADRVLMPHPYLYRYLRVDKATEEQEDQDEHEDPWRQFHTTPLPVASSAVDQAPRQPGRGESEKDDPWSDLLTAPEPVDAGADDPAPGYPGGGESAEDDPWSELLTAPVPVDASPDDPAPGYPGRGESAEDDPWSELLTAPVSVAGGDNQAPDTAPVSGVADDHASRAQVPAPVHSSHQAPPPPTTGFVPAACPD